MLELPKEMKRCVQFSTRFYIAADLHIWKIWQESNTNFTIFERISSRCYPFVKEFPEEVERYMQYFISIKSWKQSTDFFVFICDRNLWDFLYKVYSSHFCFVWERFRATPVWKTRVGAGSLELEWEFTLWVKSSESCCTL